MNPQNIATALNPTEIWKAYDLVKGIHNKTPLIEFGKVHRDGFEVNIYVKLDTLNPGGSFKDRGSLYFVHKAVLSGKLKKGDTIVTASAGNHAKGVAKAARDMGLNAIIYMSNMAPQSKIEGTKNLGAQVVLIDGDYHSAAHEAEKYSMEKGYTYVPAYEHSDIVIGQSTVATESMMQLFMLGIRPDFFVFPYGGGGLANGGGYALRHFDSNKEFIVEGYGSRIFTYGVQAENFNTMVRSFHASRLLEYVESGDTIADGIRVPNASEQMLELSHKHLDDMFDVSEDQIRDAIRRVYNSELIKEIKELAMEEPNKLKGLGFHDNHINGLDRINIIEGAAAAAFACVFTGNKIPYEDIAKLIFPRKEVIGVVIASGNNIDKSSLEEILSEIPIKS